jgi:hypothetical protein
MQQRANNAAHMRVVVDDEEAQAIEIDANHAASKVRSFCPDHTGLTVRFSR